MPLAILHYHLNRGGVTQVIANHLRALAACGAVTTDANGAVLAADVFGKGPIVILYGGRKEGWSYESSGAARAPTVTLLATPLLEYADYGRELAEGPPVPPDRVAAEIVSLLMRHGCPPERTILHIHNHSLGKNAAVTAAAGRLAAAGYRLLLQPHDFAEDFRPANYAYLQAMLGTAPLVESLYPQAPHIHYATLTARDGALLAALGVPGERLRRLPNPVFPVGELPQRVDARRRLRQTFGVSDDDAFLLYPVRGIRRKNLGEALLWAMLWPTPATVGITLSPINPVEAANYDAWRQAAAALGLPAVFGCGGDGGLDFPENLAAADAILTTSVAEGFGMVFLEACLAGKPLLGRDLPGVTTDFIAAGMRFPGLRPELWVPVDVVGEERFLGEFCEAYRQTAADYGGSVDPAELETAARCLIARNVVDFARLTPTLQLRMLRKLQQEAGQVERVRSLNPWIAEAAGQDRSDVVEGNAACVQAAFSLAPCGQRLADAYAALMGANVGPAEGLGGRHDLTRSFLAPQRFYPVRSQTLEHFQQVLE